MNTLLPLAHIAATFILDGEKYTVDKFNIEFSQPRDYKGQPQHETKGGIIVVNLTQAADDNLYLWAKKSTLTKSGKVLFQSDIGMTILEITFENAYCIDLKREINAFSGTNTSLAISPEVIKMNGIEHNNFWKK
jgi:hypothetical protein